MKSFDYALATVFILVVLVGGWAVGYSIMKRLEQPTEQRSAPAPVHMLPEDMRCCTDQGVCTWPDVGELHCPDDETTVLCSNWQHVGFGPAPGIKVYKNFYVCAQ